MILRAPVRINNESPSSAWPGTGMHGASVAPPSGLPSLNWFGRQQAAGAGQDTRRN
ncbi:hypothetical protein ABIB14_003108 [Arthrobacter sp. UYEF3]